MSVHDFDAMRAELGIAPGARILEAIDALPAEHQHAKRAHLDRLEHRYAALARAQPDVLPVLTGLASRGAKLGIVTRNSSEIALATLRRCGLAHFFGDHVVGRETAPPKPDPAGIERLLAAWRAPPSDAVMVGDFAFDLEAGARAGTATVYFDPARSHRWADQADVHITSYGELVKLLEKSWD